MPRMALDVSWRDKVSNGVLYGNLPRISTTIRHRRLRLAGHCVRHPDIAASQLILWEPTHGVASRGGQTLTYVDQLRRDTELTSAAEIRTAMGDRDVWRAFVAVRREST